MSVRVRYSDELYHYGVKGQKWGVRRFQNEDGTLTAEGKKRYKDFKKEIKFQNRRARDAMDQGAFYGGYKQRGEELARKKTAKYIANPTRANERARLAAERIQQAGKIRAGAANALASAHYKELVKKYGSEHVDPIAYGKNGIMKESKLNAAKRGVAAGTATIVVNGAMAGVGALLYGMPIPPVLYFAIPLSNRQAGQSQATGDYVAYKNALRDLDRAKKKRENGKVKEAERIEENANKVIDSMYVHHLKL